MSVPEVLKQGIPDKDAERLRVLKYFGAVSVLTAPLFALIYAGLGARQSVIALVASAPFFASSFLVFRLTRSTTFTGNWILAVGYALFFVLARLAGGIEAPVVTWAACIPLIAVLICGFRSALVWLFLTIAMTGVLYRMDSGAQSVLQEFGGEPAVDLVFFATYAGLAAFSFFLGFLSESSKKRYTEAVEKSRAELKEALERVRTLKGLLPICAWCKKVRDDKGYWDQVEVYFAKRTDAEFSHGICPECSKRLIETEESS